MKKRLGAIGLAVVILAAVLVISHLPKQVKDTLTVATVDGETAELQVDLLYYANWILPDYVKGTVTVDGVLYIDQYTKYQEFPYHADNRLFPEDWWAKGKLCNTTFLKAGCTDVISASLNRVDVLDIVFSESIEQIHYMYVDESNKADNHITGISFYGAANTAAEAVEIARSLGYQVP